MKRKLFLLLCALLTSVGMWATDYTTYLPNVGANWDFTASGPWQNPNITNTAPLGQCVEMGTYKFAEVYYDQNSGTVFEIYKTLSVPNGTYVFQMAAFGRRANVWGEDSPDTSEGINAEVFANESTVAVTSNTFVYYTVTTTVTDGSLKVGLRAKDGNKPNWWGYTDFTLVKTDGETDVDLTRLVVNPNAVTSASGWELGGYNSKWNNGNGFDGKSGFFEICNWGASSWENSASQTISNLPNGYYKIQAAGQLSSTNTWMKLTANGYEVYFNPNDAENGNILADGKETTVGGGVAGWRYSSVVARVTDGTLVMNFSSKSTAQHRWANFDNVTLIYLGDSPSGSNPIDMTGALKNASVDNGDTGWTCDGSGTFAQKIGTTFKGRGYEFYHGSRNLHQSVGSLPNGKYSVSVQATWRDAQTTKLYATTSYGSSEVTVSQERIPGSPDAPETQVAAMYDDASWGRISTDAYVTDGNLTIGLKEPSNGCWTVFDNFRLLYYGPCIASEAVALPDGGAMAAGTWYKFTPAAGNYNLTATTLGDIVYTTDGSILTEDGGDVTATFGANPVTLSATTYYIKSSSANNFTYEADSYDVTALVAAYNTAVTEAGTAKTNAEAADKVNVAEKTALDDAITTYGSVEIPVDQEHATKTQKDALETATAALTDATNAVNTSITAYANAKAYFDAVEPVLATTNFYTSAAYTANYPKAAYDDGTLSDDAAAALSYGSRRDGNMPAILLSSWAGTTLYMNTWSTEAEGVAPARDFANPFYEYWVSNGNILDANTFTSTIGELTPNALYAVTVKARVRHADKRDNIRENSFTMKVGDEGATVDLSRGKRIGTTVRYIDTYTAYGYTDNDGNLKTIITVAADSKVNWFSFRDMNYAHVEGAEALNTVIAEVTSLSGKVPTNVYNTAYAQVTAHTGVNYPTTDAEFATAISDIRSAVATAATYLDEYAGYLELKNYADALVAVTNNNPTANSTLATAISTAATDANSVANVAALTSVNTTLKAAMVTYAGAANPVGEGNKFNLTFMLDDPDVTKYWNGVPGSDNGLWGVQPDGWKNEQDGGNFQVMSNAEVVNGDKAIFMEYWSADAANNGKFTLYLEPTLPAGTYSIDCYAFAGQPTGGSTNAVYFYADDTEGGQISDAQLTKKNISFVNASEKAVKIGMKAKTGNNYRWMGIGYVELYKVPEQVYELNEASEWNHEQSGAGNVEITRTFKAGVNTVVFPFSMNQLEVENYFGEGSVVYQLSSYEDETIHFTTRLGISANEPCLVKATSTTNSAVAYILNDRTVVAAASASPSVAGTNVTMTGTYDDVTTIAQGNYIVSDDNLYIVNSDNVKMRNTRAYITLEGGSSARVSIAFDDEDPTAINAIEVAEEAEGLKDGKYLINGRIVIVNNGQAFGANGQILK